jgi:NTE family protein
VKQDPKSSPPPSHSPTSNRLTTAFVLTGGGARAAYQVGVLRALAEIHPKAPQILCGTSAGAINVGYLATHAASWTRATHQLWHLWSNLSPERIFRTDIGSFFWTGLKWLIGAIFGGFKPRGAHANHLLDTDPLRDFLARGIDGDKIHKNCESGTLRAVSLTTTNYFSGTSVIFFDSDASIQPWARSNRVALKTKIGIDHIMGSSAVPVFFPPIGVDGTYYGDGCVRENSPLSPAIHLGADRIIAIGIRHPRTSAQAVALSTACQLERPGLAQIAGVLLNSIFLDSLDADTDRLSRINAAISELPEGIQHPLFRKIPILVLRPSQELGSLAEEGIRALPKTLLFLFRGIGAAKGQGTDLLSYFTFHQSYTRRLMDLGYQDTLARRAEITQFLASE